jgi:uncharacterized OsmC-like protein
MAQADLREYRVHARSTDTFGRVLASARQQHLVVDGPIENGCPGEAITPGEMFLAGVACCGVELIQVLARDRELSLRGVTASIHGVVDRGHPVRPDLTLFNSVHLELQLTGVDTDRAEELVEAFKGR